MQTNRSPDIARTTLQLLALGVLIASSFWIVHPFLVAVTWATMIVVATWPLLLHAQAWPRGKIDATWNGKLIGCRVGARSMWTRIATLTGSLDIPQAPAAQCVRQALDL